MEKLVLRGVLYGVDKIPDAWFDKIPGGFYKAKDDKLHIKKQQPSQRQRSHSDDEYDDDRRTSHGSKYGRPSKDNPAGRYEAENYSDGDEYARDRRSGERRDTARTRRSTQYDRGGSDRRPYFDIPDYRGPRGDSRRDTNGPRPRAPYPDSTAPSSPRLPKGYVPPMQPPPAPPELDPSAALKGSPAPAMPTNSHSAAAVRGSVPPGVRSAQAIPATGPIPYVPYAHIYGQSTGTPSIPTMSPPGAPSFGSPNGFAPAPVGVAKQPSIPISPTNPAVRVSLSAERLAEEGMGPRRGHASYDPYGSDREDDRHRSDTPERQAPYERARRKRGSDESARERVDDHLPPLDGRPTKSSPPMMTGALPYRSSSAIPPHGRGSHEQSPRSSDHKGASIDSHPVTVMSQIPPSSSRRKEDARVDSFANEGEIRLTSEERRQILEQRRRMDERHGSD